VGHEKWGIVKWIDYKPLKTKGLVKKPLWPQALVIHMENGT